MPKPGYYYYQNKRAFKGLVFVGIFAIGVFLEKNFRNSSNEDVFLVIYAHRFLASALIVATVVSWWGLRRLQMLWCEPRPKHYKSRSEFVRALERYAERNKYKHGWVYYRSSELWPESFDE